jgi:hypothetical protein
MFQGAKDALNPANIIRQIREDPFAQSGHPLGIQNDEAEEAQRAMWESLKTPEGQGALVAGAGTALLPFKMNFKMPKSASQRVLDYPTMDSSRWRIKNRNMGAHGGFGGRFGSVEDRMALARQEQAPSMEEHIAYLDALERAQRGGGVIPQGLRDLMNNSTEGNLRGMAQYGARQDRSVAPIHMRERVEAGDWPGLRNPKPKNKQMTLAEANAWDEQFESDFGVPDEFGDPDPYSIWGSEPDYPRPTTAWQAWNQQVGPQSLEHLSSRYRSLGGSDDARKMGIDFEGNKGGTSVQPSFGYYSGGKQGAEAVVNMLLSKNPKLFKKLYNRGD